jgi:hypothetical protein
MSTDDETEGGFEYLNNSFVETDGEDDDGSRGYEDIENENGAKNMTLRTMKTMVFKMKCQFNSYATIPSLCLLFEQFFNVYHFLGNLVSVVTHAEPDSSEVRV